MSKDQSRAPILEAITRYHDTGYINFTPPGHRGGDGVDEETLAVLGTGVFAHDIDMLNGLDDRGEQQQILSQAQELMADALGVKSSLFSTGGSTLSVQTAFLALADRGDEVIVARNSHKSVFESIVLSGVHPVFASPEWDEEWEFSHPPSAHTIEGLLHEHPNAKAVFVVSPTDYGSVAQVKEIADACHLHDTPLILDEAWGAHLPWHPDLPVSGIQAGADLTIHSVHKTGGGLLQASALHIQGDLVDDVEIAQRMDLLASTSPTPLIYASIDGWRRQMALHGREILDRSLRDLNAFRDQVRTIEGYRLFDGNGTPGRNIAGIDPYKLTLDVGDLGTTGFEVVEQLRQDHQVNVLLGNRRRITAILAPADDQQRYARLLQALRAVAADPHHDKQRKVEMPELRDFEHLDVAMTPREAFFAETEQVKANKAVGRICAEMISPYPPGIPVLLPGTKITEEIVTYLRTGADAGYLIPDAIDATLQTIRVIA